MNEQGFFDDIEASDEYTAGKNFVLIPADTVVTAKVTKVEYKTNEEKMLNEYLSIEWTIAGGEYAGQTLTQSALINSDDDVKRKKGKRLIATLFTICGVDIKKIKTPTLKIESIEKTICNKPIKLTIGVMDRKVIDAMGEEKTYQNNFIAKIQKVESKVDSDGDDDDIGF